jgi:hypothetical protein
MGRPLAHVPDRRATATRATPATSPASSSTLRRLGIHPDRYYWMSDIYPTGAMDPVHPDGLDRPALVREIYRRVANVQHPDTWHPLGVICPTCGKVGTTIVDRLGRRAVFFECRRDLVDVGARLWLVRLDQPVRRASRSCPGTWNGRRQWSLFGVTIEPGARTFRPPAAHETGATRSPARCSSASRRSTSRTSSSTSAARRCRPPRDRGSCPHDRRGHPAGAAPFLFLRPRPNQAIEFDPDGTDACRACSTSSTSSPRRRPVVRSRARSRPGYEATFRYSLLDPNADVRAAAALFRPAFAHLALLVQIPGVDVAAAVERRRAAR